jgi:hypothetical protein
MKLKSVIFFAFAAIICFSCERSTNYSAQRKQENAKIKKYISDKGFEVRALKDLVLDSVYDNKILFNNSEDSIYFRLISTDTTGKIIELGDRLQVRYIESTLDDNPTVESYWTTTDLPDPIEIVYGIEANNCAGWQTAFRLMHRSGSEAEFIVPSRCGLSKAKVNSTNVLIPYHYRLKFIIESK